MRDEINSEEEETVSVTRTRKNYSTPGNIGADLGDLTAARYSPAFAPGSTKSPDLGDDVLRPVRQAEQRSSPPGPTWPYQNGYHDNPREDPDARRGYGIAQPQRLATGGVRGPAGGELPSYRTPSSHDERVDTPQSGRLSQAALMVREAFEEDGEFDQEVAVSRGKVKQTIRIQQFAV